MGRTSTPALARWAAKKGRTGGFYADRELARRAGAIGGRKSRRKPKGRAMCIDRAGNMTVAILLLIAGCVMTAKFHAFGVLAVDSDS